MTQSARCLYKAIGLARIAQIIPTIPDPASSPVKGALLGLMLPGVHFLNLVSVLDEALCDYLELKGIPWPPNTKPNLFNRINIVSKFVQELNAARLHQIREMRNSIAHSLDTSQDQAITWISLDEAIKVIAEAFLVMELIMSTPQIVAFYEREPTLFLDELGPNGERMRHKHRIGAKINDEVFLEYSNEISYFPPEAP